MLYSAATLLLLDKVNPKIVANLLGHKEVGITLNRYSHLLEEMRSIATDAMNKRFSNHADTSKSITS